MEFAMNNSEIVSIIHLQIPSISAMRNSTHDSLMQISSSQSRHLTTSTIPHQEMLRMKFLNSSVMTWVCQGYWWSNYSAKCQGWKLSDWLKRYHNIFFLFYSFEVLAWLFWFLFTKRNLRIIVDISQISYWYFSYECIYYYNSCLILK